MVGFDVPQRLLRRMQQGWSAPRACATARPACSLRLATPVNRRSLLMHRVTIHLFMHPAGLTCSNGAARCDVRTPSRALPAPSARRTKSREVQAWRARLAGPLALASLTGKVDNFTTV